MTTETSVCIVKAEDYRCYLQTIITTVRESVVSQILNAAGHPHIKIQVSKGGQFVNLFPKTITVGVGESQIHYRATRVPQDKVSDGQ